LGKGTPSGMPVEVFPDVGALALRFRNRAP
jgi:hypothetical protein